MPQFNALATQRPMHGQPPMMTPGGGGTGAQLMGGQPPMLPPTQIGMVPGVPGSMGLNPGGPAVDVGPLQGAGGLAPGAMPMGGGMALPPQLPDMGHGPMNPWHQAKMDWRQQRPDFAPGGDPQAFHQSLMDWKSQRPDHQSFMQNYGQPGNTGIVPPGMLPPVQNALAPAQMMPIAPQIAAPQMAQDPYGVQGMVQSSNPYQLPTY